MDSSRVEVCSGNPHEMWLAQGVFEWLRFLNSQSRPGEQRIMEAIMLQMRKGTMEELLATAEVHSVFLVTQSHWAAPAHGRKGVALCEG